MKKGILVVLTGLWVALITPTAMASVIISGDASYDASTGEVKIGPEETSCWDANQEVGFHGFEFSFEEAMDVSLSLLWETRDDERFDNGLVTVIDENGQESTIFSWHGQDNWWDYTTETIQLSMDFTMEARSTLAFGWNTGYDQYFSSNAMGEISFTPVVSGAQPVPEPATMLLFGTGLAGLVGAQRKRKSKA